MNRKVQQQLRELVQPFRYKTNNMFYWYKFVTQFESTLHFALYMHIGISNFGNVIKQYYNKDVHKKVIISFGNESLYQLEDDYKRCVNIFELLHRWAEQANVSPSIIEFRNGNQLVEYAYNNWCIQHKIDCRLGLVSWYDVWAANTLRTHKSSHKKIIKSTNTVKPFYYTFQNNKLRWHRLKLLENLYDNDLLKYGACSFIFSPEEVENNKHIINSRDDILNLIPQSRENLTSSKSTRYPTIMNRDVEHLAIHDFLSYFTDSYYDFIPETVFEPHSFQLGTACAEDYWKYFFFSEKTWRSIMFKRPFVMINSPGALAKLKEHGFKTFGRWWDESYDTIENPYKRIDALVQLNKDIINTYSLEELHQIVNVEMVDVLEHNYSLLPTYASKYELPQPNTKKIHSLSYLTHPASPEFVGFDNLNSYVIDDNTVSNAPEYLKSWKTH